MATNYSPDSIQAAVLRSAAGRQGQGDPAAATNLGAASATMGSTSSAAPMDVAPNLQANAVKQDLSVLANQAGKYTAGVTQGGLQAIQQAAATNTRLDEAKAQQDAQRAQQLQLEELAKQALALKQQAQAQAAAQQIAEIRAAAAARAASAGGGANDPGYEAGRLVRNAALGNTDPDTKAILDFAFDNAHGLDEANNVFRGLKATYPKANKDAFDTYYRMYYNAVNTGIPPKPGWGLYQKPTGAPKKSTLIGYGGGGN